MFKQSWIPFTEGCIVSNLVKIGPEVLDKNIFKCCQCNLAFLLLSPLKKMCGPSYEQNWIPFTQGCFVPSLVKIGPVILEKKIFNVVNVFLLFCYYFPTEKGLALHLKKLDSLYPKTLCATFDWNEPSGSGGEDEHDYSLQTDRWQTDRQIMDNRWSKSLLKLSTQVS